jgi:hypothetical protein
MIGRTLSHYHYSIRSVRVGWAKSKRGALPLVQVRERRSRLQKPSYRPALPRPPEPHEFPGVSGLGTSRCEDEAISVSCCKEIV